MYAKLTLLKNKNIFSWGVIGMANQEHLDILKQGVVMWSRWRKEHADIKPNFIEADLNRADLSRANLRGADLTGANLIEADLSRADLSRATLSGADLREAIVREAIVREAIVRGVDFSGANLSGANLSGASLSGTDLRGVILRGANLSGTDLRGVNLRGANLSKARVGWTIFGDNDLSAVKGLETIEHAGPSTIGIDTLYRSQGRIPEMFLRDAGVPDSLIDYMRSLVGKPFDYYSCFISYSSGDEAFAKRLHADLQSNNVRSWFAPEDMKIGDKIRPRIDETIRMYDKLLLVLSQHSVASKWVEYEVETALNKEQEGKSPVLFPVRLDGAVMESTTAWAAHIKRTRHIGDFTRWKNHNAYEKAFARLLRDLKAESQ